MKQTLLIRADASSEIGVGHVMRCLALAEAWQAIGGNVYFAAASMPEAIRHRLSGQGFEVVHLPASNTASSLLEVADRVQSNHVVLDGRFDSNYQREIKGAGLSAMVIDDYGCGAPFSADCIVNPDLVAESMYEQREPYTRLLLGPEYALLRTEFLRYREPKQPANLCRILVTLGGSDPENMSLVVMQAMEQLLVKDVQVRVIVGAANPRFELLRQMADTLPVQIQVLRDVTDMPNEMQWADVAVVAAGVTLWELLYMGTAVVCWPRYQQDVPVMDSLASQGVLLPLTVDANPSLIADSLNQLLSNSELRRRLQSAGKKLVDGRGARRVAEVFSQLPAKRVEGVQAH
ncbi:MAG TPA: UDP-2,4-diacetamido-2,4,6-trideoxy-beta-L-altropyranose hydrolase [Terriglobales bacterium]|nr:UDP-2,4-diacetamido-2,4,6-trideoxy-beta-L-altropyranose hydrolase [Terriglobales bacterium]